MNTIPQSFAQFFQLPRGGAERTSPTPQPTVSPGKILNGATIRSPVRFLNGLTGPVAIVKFTHFLRPSGAPACSLGWSNAEPHRSRDRRYVRCVGAVAVRAQVNPPRRKWGHREIGSGLVLSHSLLAESWGQMRMIAHQTTTVTQPSEPRYYSSQHPNPPSPRVRS